MKTLKITVAALAIAGFATAAQAQDGNTYGAIGVTSYDFDAYGIEGKLGYNFTEYFGVEGQGAFGVSGNEETVGGVTFEGDIDYNVAGFGVVRFPASENFDVFARAGYHSTGISIEANNVEVSADTDGFAVGAGGQYFWDGLNGVRGEYTYLDGDSGTSLDTYTLSYVRKF